MSNARDPSATEFLAEAEFDAALLACIRWKADEQDIGRDRSPREYTSKFARSRRDGGGAAARVDVLGGNPESVRDLIDAELTDVAGGFSMLQHGCSMRAGSVPSRPAPVVWGRASSVQRFFGL